MTFVIHYATPTEPAVAEFDNVDATASFIEALPDDRSAFIWEENQSSIPTSTLVALWNRGNPEKPVKKFENRSIAMKRVEEVLHGLAVVDGAHARVAAKKAIEEVTDKTPTPAPAKSGSPAKGRRLGVGARMAALIREEKTTDEILETIRKEFPTSRAGRSDVSIVRGKVKRGDL